MEATWYDTRASSAYEAFKHIRHGYQYNGQKTWFKSIMLHTRPHADQSAPEVYLRGGKAVI